MQPLLMVLPPPSITEPQRFLSSVGNEGAIGSARRSGGASGQGVSLSGVTITVS